MGKGVVIMNVLDAMHLVTVKDEVLTELVDFIAIERGDNTSTLLLTDEMMVLLFNQHQDALLSAKEVKITMEVL